MSKKTPIEDRSLPYQMGAAFATSTAASAGLFAGLALFAVVSDIFKRNSKTEENQTQN